MNQIVNFNIVFKVISRNLFILTGALLSCLGVAVIFTEPLMPFIWTSAISLSLGLFMHFSTHSQIEDAAVTKKEAYLTVSLSWALISLVGSLPYLFSQAIPSFVNALFESVSGFTTTGASILTEIESLPKSILFWRSMTHWVGGIGIIVLVVIVMPTLQIGGYNLFTLESSLQDKIRPRIRSVGHRLLLIYLVLTLSEIILLLLGDMNLFDSVCHAFGTVATGGFSPRNTSIAEYSPYIQYVIMVFMLLAGTNFIVFYYLYKLDFKKALNNEELRFYLKIILFVGLIITAGLFFQTDRSLEQSFRESFFQLISIVTCTGFATADYLQWPTFLWIIIFLSMFLGGCTGSTAGGIKMARHLLLLKNFKKILTNLLHPNAIIPIRLNKNTLNDSTNNSIMTFITVYGIIFILGTILMVASGLDGETASSSVATCMAGIGPGIGTVGPASNFAHLSLPGKSILTFLMIIGRLEIYTVIMLFTPEFWRN
ncbi:MAG: TrkH family potassium uptake protein [Candidatus Atribacteria bacterium]|nr:TrkH family potassium uptake protein [Candidatus Atribacteria bacterium]MBN2747539.1 TrkH family potassium uptake protein [Bacteroidales bacterium]